MLYLIIPCYNEQEVLPGSHERLLALVRSLPLTTTLFYVDDGSTDNTWSIIQSMCRNCENVRGLRLSHNVGQQTAVWAGLEHCVVDGDAFITIDADLQDDLEAVGRMVEEWLKGTDVVYGVRRKRHTDTFIKRFTAIMFYRIMDWMGCETVYNHSEFRLLSRRVAMALLSYPERNLFLRGIVPLLGFRSTNVYYDRKARMAGDTKYGLVRLAGLAFEGITSFSIRPLHWILAAGLFSILIAFGVIGWALFNHFTRQAVPGWTSLLVSQWLVGGILLMAVGLTGEYVGKVYKEAKRRPRYFVMEEIK